MHITTMCRRIEALEKTLPPMCARAAEEKIRNRALEHLSNEELALLINWFRAQEQGRSADDSEWEALGAYQAALAQERERG